MPREDQTFTIRNIRPRRVVHVLGRVLAPAIRGGRSDLDLTEEEFFSAPVQRLLELRRVEVVRANGETREQYEARVQKDREQPLSEEAADVHAGRAEEILKLQEAPPSGPPEGTDPRIAHLWDDGKTPDQSAIDEALAALEEAEKSGDDSDEPEESAEDPEPEEPKAEDPEPGPPSLDDVDHVWDYDSLKALNASDQKVICRSRGLKTSGREDDRITRILDAQNGES